jgi:tetratricopeptide (TPR) repeat protein
VSFTLLLYSLPKTIVKQNTSIDQNTSSISLDISNQPSTHQFNAEKKVASLKQVLKKNVNEETLLAIIQSYKNGYVYDSAIKYSTELLNKYPNKANKLLVADVYFDAFMNAQNEKETATYSEMARALYESEKDSNNNINAKLAMTYTTTANPMKGVLMLKEIVKQNPTHELANYYLGLLSLKSNQFDKAKERFNILTSNYPNNNTYRYYLGICYAKLGENNLAISEFNTILNQTRDVYLIKSVQELIKQLK